MLSNQSWQWRQPDAFDWLITVRAQPFFIEQASLVQQCYIHTYKRPSASIVELASGDGLRYPIIICHFFWFNMMSPIVSETLTKSWKILVLHYKWILIWSGTICLLSSLRWISPDYLYTIWNISSFKFFTILFHEWCIIISNWKKPLFINNVILVSWRSILFKWLINITCEIITVPLRRRPLH